MTLLASPFRGQLVADAGRGAGLVKLVEMEFRLRPGSGMQHTRKRTSRGPRGERGAAALSCANCRSGHSARALQSNWSQILPVRWIALLLCYVYHTIRSRRTLLGDSVMYGSNTSSLMFKIESYDRILRKYLLLKICYEFAFYAHRLLCN